MQLAGQSYKRKSITTLYSQRKIERMSAVTIVVLGALWGVTYVLSAISTPTDVGDASFFLTSFLILLIGTGCWVVIEVMYDARNCGYSASQAADNRDVLCRLKDKRVYTFVSLPVFVLLIWKCGFTVASLFFALGLAWLLGERRPRMMIIVSIIVLSIVWLLFATLLSVPLPLWPA